MPKGPRYFLMAFGACMLTASSAYAAVGQVPIVLDTWCNANGHPIHRDGITDDSGCVAAAVVYAESVNAELQIPSGGPILLAGGSQVILNNITMFSNDYEDRGNVYGHQGAVFWMTDTAKSPFTLGNNSVTVQGINFFWPNQPNSNVTPIVYPALFSPSPTGLTQAFKFRHSTVINAYNFLDFNAATIGTVDIGDSNIWAVNNAFMLGNVPEVFFIHDCLFSLGVGAGSTSPLALWYSQHGTFAVISGLAAINAVDVYVFGSRYGVHVLSTGNVYLGRFLGGGFDQIPSILTIDPGGTMGAFAFGSQYWNAQFYNSNAPLPAAAVYIPNASGTASQQIIFNDIFASAHGSLFNITGIKNLGPKISGMEAYICVAQTSGRCDFITGSANFMADDNQITSVGSGSATSYGITVNGLNRPNAPQTVTVNGNTFYNMINSVTVNTAEDRVVMLGNASTNTVTKDVTGTYTTNLFVGANAWSKP
jgi:hypothetical protein